MKGIKLSEKHARLVWEKKKTMIVLDKQVRFGMNQPLCVVDNNQAYGIIKLTSMQNISKDFERQTFRHKMTLSEKNENWNPVLRQPIYGYDFEYVELFDEPRKIDVPDSTFFSIPQYDNIVNKDFLMSTENDFKLFKPFMPLKTSKIFSDPKLLVKDLYSWIRSKKEKEGREDKVEVTKAFADAYFIEKRIKGKRAILHKKGDKVMLFDENKKDITKHWPTCNQAKELSTYDYIIDGTFKNGVFHVFDVLYFNNNSLQNLHQYERKKVLDSFEWTTHIRKINSLQVKESWSMLKVVQAMKTLPDSDGAMIKSFIGTYPTTGLTERWLWCKLN